MAIETYTPDADDAQGLSRTFPDLSEEEQAAHDPFYGSAKFVGIPVMNEILALIRSVYASGSVPRNGFKNRIINGGMEIWQRGTSFVSPANGSYLCDRFKIIRSTAVHTFTQSTDVPSSTDFTNEGVAPYRPFNYSLKADLTTVTGTGAADYCTIRHIIEGRNIYDLVGNGYNTGFTISFWLKTGKTGTMATRFYGGGASESPSYVKNISTTAGVWERHVITVTSAPASGTWEKTTGIGLGFDLVLYAGTDYDDGVDGTWVNSLELSAGGNTNYADTVAGTTCDIYLTGMQLESGTNPSPFEFIPIPQLLHMCQRYFWRFTMPNATTRYFANGMTNTSSRAYCIINYPCFMRTESPTFEYSSAGHFFFFDTGATGIGSTIVTYAGDNSRCLLELNTTAAVLTVGRGGYFGCNSASGYYGATDEL